MKSDPTLGAPRRCATPSTPQGTRLQSAMSTAMGDETLCETVGTVDRNPPWVTRAKSAPSIPGPIRDFTASQRLLPSSPLSNTTIGPAKFFPLKLFLRLSQFFPASRKEVLEALVKTTRRSRRPMTTLCLRPASGAAQTQRGFGVLSACNTIAGDKPGRSIVRTRPRLL